MGIRPAFQNTARRWQFEGAGPVAAGRAIVGSGGSRDSRRVFLVRDENARQVWWAVYPELSEGGPGLSGAVTSRAEAQTMRLALLYALLDSSDCIRREHLVAALALWEYVEASAQCVFGDSMGRSGGRRHSPRSAERPMTA